MQGNCKHLFIFGYKLNVKKNNNNKNAVNDKTIKRWRMPSGGKHLIALLANSQPIVKSINFFFSLVRLQVAETTTVLNLKKEISKLLNVPVPRQKILFVGRTLADDKPLNAYATIKNGSKLTVVIKEPEPLKDVMWKIFKKFYSDEQSEAMAKEFMIDFEKRMDQLSLDDIERMATYFLERDRQLYGET